MFSSVDFFTSNIGSVYSSHFCSNAINLKKNIRTKLFTQFPFCSITLCVSLTLSFLTLSILVTAHLILRFLTFTKNCSASFTHMSFLISMFAPTLVHRAHSSNKNLLYIKHYTPSSHISIVNSTFGLNV